MGAHCNFQLNLILNDFKMKKNNNNNNKNVAVFVIIHKYPLKLL